MIAIGCDHGGFELKEKIVEFLKSKSYELTDFGTYSEESVDYPVYAKKVAEAILDENNPCKRGILVCGTGIGISITANKYKGIRAALCHDKDSARLTREHNNSNIVALGGRIVDHKLALEIVEIFLNTEFSNDERHIRRIEMIEN